MRTRTSGQGRPKGIPNRITSDVRGMVLAALDAAGGIEYLVTQARENPTAFLTLVGKILPREVKADVAASPNIPRLSPERMAGIAEAILGGLDSSGAR